VKILDGKAVSLTRRLILKDRVINFISKAVRQPHLCVVLIGEDPASQVYVRNKIKACEAVGIKSTQHKLSKDISQSELEELVRSLNQDDSVDGVLVQLPLPKGLDDKRINEILKPEKDVDGFTHLALGKLMASEVGVAPCTPKGVMSILEQYKIPVEGKHVVVVGRSVTVGKPMVQLMINANATVTVCHSKTKNLRAFTILGDIVVVAAGKRQFLGREDFKKDAIVIDVGIHGSGTAGEIVGDVNVEGLEDWLQAMTPVPGGVGPMTITTLLENTMELAERRAGVTPP
jgi:methylenetetrahydrofolate dehydrogenase (NADP+) / methenyltetrahydrofolate cyclohydrolase